MKYKYENKSLDDLKITNHDYKLQKWLYLFWR